MKRYTRIYDGEDTSIEDDIIITPLKDNAEWLSDRFIDNP